jgi:general secretion pathway protein I
MSALKIRSFKSARRTNRGFTLLEVMLAFVIFAISFATVLEIMAGSMRSVRRASEDTEVALLAQSVMDLVGVEIPIEEGQFSGTSMERYDWQLDIYLYQSGGDETGTQELAELSGIELYGVELTVGWQSGRHERDMRFNTVKSMLADRR